MLKNMKKIQLFILSALLIFAGKTFAQHQNHEKKTEVTKSEMPNLGKVDGVIKKQLNDLLLAYFQIKNELVADRRDNANAKGKIFLEILAKIEVKKMTTEQANFFNEQQKKLVFNAQNIADNEEVDAQRAFFAELSTTMKIIIIAFKANSHKVYEQHCPMAFDNAGASWLSAENQIFNPYFGDRMLKCGVVTSEF
jgi:Cu(I)/Ag(I) efflux system membrane fusion protein